MQIKYLLILLVILPLICLTVADEPVTDTKCTCGLTIIVFCPGAFQCWNACKDWKAWYTVCVLNEGDGNHYCECFGGKKGENEPNQLKYLK